MNSIKRITILTLAAFSTLLAFAAASPQAPAWKSLYNGKDLTGWKHVGPGGMTVEDGLIRTHGGMGLLYWTGGKLGNCRIRVVYKMRDHNDNSGVFIRIPLEPREEWMPVPHHRHSLFAYKTSRAPRQIRPRLEHHAHHSRWSAHPRRA
jgi:hypothetical protein